MDTKLYLLFVIICAGCSESVSNSKSTKKEGLRVSRNYKLRGESLEQLFAVYDPTFLSVVWPKISNGLHLDVSHFCWEDVFVFFKDLSEGRAWAFNVADASGRYQGGALGGSTFWLGSRQRCLELDKNFLSRDNSTSDDLFEGEYLMALLQREKIYGPGGQEWRQLVQRDDMIQRLVSIDNRPPYRLAFSVASLRLNITKITMAKSYDVTLGLCLPRSCSPDDVESILALSIVINDNLKSNRTVPRIAKITSLRQLHDYYRIEVDSGAILLISITMFLLILSIAATIVELNLFKCRILNPRSSRSVSFDLQKYNNTDSHRRFLDNIKKKHIDNVWKEYPLGKLNMVDDNVNVKKPAAPPTVTLDVMCMEKALGSCNRCGKYKKQCSGLPTQSENLPACPRVKYSSVASLSSGERKISFVKKLLMCYSLRYSWRRIFNTNMANKDLSVVHLMRVIATLWVIYVHVAVMVNYIADDTGEVNERNDIYYVLATGTLAFDTLLFVSGLFSAHHFFYLKSHYTVEELVSFGGGCGQVLQFVCFVTNRIIRLLPSYAYAILLCGVMARVSRDTAALSLPPRDGDNCKYYWWRNLLYLTNIYPAEERCMQVSWYLSAETQLHAAGALLCAAWAGGVGGVGGVGGSGVRGRGLAAVAAVALLAATGADVSSAYADFGQYLPGVSEAYVAIIERPWARVVPYFIGIFTGWMVHRAKGKVSFSKVTASCLWSASASTLLTSALVPWLALDWLTAWIHLTWPLSLLWPTLVCSTNYASVARRLLDSGGLAALSRLSYGSLLLHGAVGRALLLSADKALSAHAACVWSYFASTTMLTVIGALFLSLLVEMPCCSLLRRLSDCASV